MLLSGVIANSVGVSIGALIGIALKSKFPEKIIQNLMTGMGLCVTYVGISGSLKGHNTLVVIISMAIGGILGELISIEKRLEQFGKLLESFAKPKKNDGKIVEAFVNSTLFICVGAMAIVGSLQSGLSGDHQTLYAKALIDCIVVITMASTMGIGVLFSTLTVFVYEAAMTLSANYISIFLTQTVIDEVTCVGSILIMAIGFNMLGVSKLKISNLCLSPFIPIIIYAFIK